MNIDLNSLSVTELEALAVQVQSTIASKKAQAKKTLIADMEKLARDAGVSLAELFGSTSAPAKSTKPKATVAAKYRNPNDSSQTWTGRGRQPLWLAALVAEGRALDDFLI